MKPGERIIVALDVDSPDRAEEITAELAPYVGAFKIGKELFTACGPDAVSRIQGRGGRVFLDLKFHDIPNTVLGACREAAEMGVRMITVHASGGGEMIQAARTGAAQGASSQENRPAVLAVTVLTSISGDMLANELRIPHTPREQVGFWAHLAQENGADGVVCSPQEIEIVRKECGRGFLVVTPGIRPAWSVDNDQKRVASPADALRRGADYLVIGRPVTQSGDRTEAVRRITEEMTEHD